jgi:uncharacterized membrane protein
MDAADQTSSTGLDPKLAGLLSYLLGFISGLVFLVLEKQSSFVRFHAYQSTIAFLSLFVVNIVLTFVPLLGGLLSALLGLASLVIWIVLMVKAFQGERFKLPVIGDMAEERAGS